MQRSKEQQKEIRKPSSATNAKKQRKTTDFLSTRDHFKKIRDAKGTFHAKMGLIKGRNGMDLIEAEDIKKRWQEYTEELWTEVHNIVQETMIKTIPKTKKCKKAKWLSEEALQIAEKRREVKGKGEKKSSECRVPNNSKER